MADWSRRFFDPIDLPSGRQIATLREAANYITALPAAEHDLPHWRAAVEVLILSAEHGESGADPIFARVGMIRAQCQRANRAASTTEQGHQEIQGRPLARALRVHPVEIELSPSSRA
jgi:hypothetical protein